MLNWKNYGILSVKKFVGKKSDEKSLGEFFLPTNIPMIIFCRRIDSFELFFVENWIFGMLIPGSCAVYNKIFDGI